MKNKNKPYWTKEGHIISGIHRGVAYSGKVVKSYEKSSGGYSHQIHLFEPIVVDDETLESIVVDDLLTVFRV